MKMHSLKLVYFSPTGTTKTVMEEIAHGINQIYTFRAKSIICRCVVMSHALQLQGGELVIWKRPLHLISESTRK